MEKPLLKKDNILWVLLFEKILQNVDAFVMVSEQNGKVIFTNNKYLRFFGLKINDIIGKQWIEVIIPDENREAVTKAFDAMKLRRGLGRFDSPVMDVRGAKFFVSWTELTLISDDRALFMFIGRKNEDAPGIGVKVHGDFIRLKTAYKDVVETLFAATRVSDPATAEHAAKVMDYAVLLAERLNLGEERVERLRIACLLHDLGKLVVDEKILLKKDKLTKAEFEEIKNHPTWGAEVVQLVYFLHDIIPIMVSHHENYDGTGYPKKTKGNDIPLEARILSIADVYEALTADRPYRKGFSKEVAITIMESERGRKFDPELIDIFLNILKDRKD